MGNKPNYLRMRTMKDDARKAEKQNPTALKTMAHCNVLERVSYFGPNQKLPQIPEEFKHNSQFLTATFNDETQQWTVNLHFGRNGEQSKEVMITAEATQKVMQWMQNWESTANTLCGHGVNIDHILPDAKLISLQVSNDNDDYDINSGAMG